MTLRTFLLSAALIAVCPARAQIRLPSLPALPAPPLTQTLNQLETRTSDALTRQREIDLLVRNNRRDIDTDPDGQPIVRSEVLAMGMSDGALAKSSFLGFAVDREWSIDSAGTRFVVLKAPRRGSAKDALRQLRDADPTGVYDYNHIYLGAGSAPGDSSHDDAFVPEDASAGAQRTEPAVRIGLLDSGVDSTHAAFRGSAVHRWGCGERRVPSPHGTAVASLLVAHTSAELYAADVYCGAPTGGSVDTIVAALGWMAEQRVAVINVSLVGPKNLALERVVLTLIERGHLIVAAVGNDGPAAPPLYPAAYPGVVGVTAVDARRRVLIEAGRGPQVMFAARGADLKAAIIPAGYAAVRGTSYAAPEVSALLAMRLTHPDPQAAAADIDDLARRAIPLGAPGKDLTYGYGLVGEHF